MSQPPHATNTRERFIAAATTLFAEKGFYGASMDHIAREVGLTKQALIHHFGSKEKLYGAVLEDISDRLLADLASVEIPAAQDRTEAFLQALDKIYRRTVQRHADTQLLMRELLDNRRRAARAASWYLKPFLDRLEQLLSEDPRWDQAGRLPRQTHIYQLLGAINYFAVSTETLKAMYSTRHVNAMAKAFPAQLRRLADASPQSVD
ncbi:MAG: TetR/AcrR family transcriptional regulator [Pseudomonadota bacterium]